jgi:hypothetical protein
LPIDNPGIIISANQDVSLLKFTHKDFSESEPMLLGKVEPSFKLRTSVKEFRDLTEEKMSSASVVKAVFSRSRTVKALRVGSEPAGRLPSPAILRLVSVEMEESSDGIAAGTPGKVRTLKRSKST